MYVFCVQTFTFFFQWFSDMSSDLMKVKDTAHADVEEDEVEQQPLGEDQQHKLSILLRHAHSLWPLPKYSVVTPLPCLSVDSTLKIARQLGVKRGFSTQVNNLTKVVCIPRGASCSSLPYYTSLSHKFAADFCDKALFLPLQVLMCLQKPQATFRARAIRALTDIVSSDPSLMGQPHIQTALKVTLNDEATSVCHSLSVSCCSPFYMH
jgi:hypothetical protein